MGSQKGKIYFPAFTNLNSVDRATETGCARQSIADLQHERLASRQLVALHGISDELQFMVRDALLGE
ncbi:MAG: hypothetical protein ACJ8MR_20250, partial [Povalibacter sp.]